MFTLKSNKTFRLYIDYKKLNDITIKNRYLLSNINELQNKLNKTKFFIKLNFRKKYYFIKIKTKKNKKKYLNVNINFTNTQLCCLN